jgi:hypothetical protein
MSLVTTDEDQSPPPEFTLWGLEPRGGGFHMLAERCISWTAADGCWFVGTATGVAECFPFAHWAQLRFVPAGDEE